MQLKKFSSLGIETVLLNVALWITVYKGILGGSFSGIGDTLGSFYIAYFVFAVVVSVAYTMLRLLFALRRKSFISYALIVFLLGVPISITFFLLAILISEGHLSIWLIVLPVLPLILLALRYLFLKVIAKKSSA